MRFVRGLGSCDEVGGICGIYYVVRLLIYNCDMKVTHAFYTSVQRRRYILGIIN